MALFCGKNGSMAWVYISPHLDDVALSCGGLVWEQAQAGQRVSVWSICAGDPPLGPLPPFAQSLHTSWNTGREAVAQRRAEDIESCARMGASWRHFSVPDCIYRRGEKDGEPLYASEESLFNRLHSSEANLVHKLSAELAQSLRRLAPNPERNVAAERDIKLVCPLTLGGHVDHRLARAALESLGQSLWYYADYPYVLDHAGELTHLQGLGWEAVVFPISERGLKAWEQAVAAHASQISTFWPDLDSMKAALRDYLQQVGITLWRPPSERYLHTIQTSVDGKTSRGDTSSDPLILNPTDSLLRSWCCWTSVRVGSAVWTHALPL